jgi:hypothetical protein
MVRPVGAVRLGLRAAWRQPWLVILVWALFLGAALLAAAPAWRWWSGSLSLAPEGDRLLDGLNAALLRELSHYDRSSTWGIAFSTFSAFLLATLVLNPFMAGGTLSVLYGAHRAEADGDVVPPAHVRLTTFFRHGALHYGPFLRMLLLAGIVFALLGIVFVVPLMPVLHIADNNELERLYLLAGAMIPVALLAAFGLTSLLLDIARIRAMREGQRRAWRALTGAIRFVWRNLGASLGIGIAFALLTALTFAVYFLVASAFTPKSWIAILLAMVWQQMLSLVRTWLRVSMLGAELALVSAREPASIRTTLGPSLQPAAPPSPAPEPAPPPAAPPIEDLPPLA